MPSRLVYNMTRSGIQKTVHKELSTQMWKKYTVAIIFHYRLLCLSIKETMKQSKYINTQKEKKTVAVIFHERKFATTRVHLNTH